MHYTVPLDAQKFVTFQFPLSTDTDTQKKNGKKWLGYPVSSVRFSATLHFHYGGSKWVRVAPHSDFVHPLDPFPLAPIYKSPSTHFPSLPVCGALLEIFRIALESLGSRGVGIPSIGRCLQRTGPKINWPIGQIRKKTKGNRGGSNRLCCLTIK